MQELYRLCPGIAENLRKDAAPEVFPLRVRDRGRATVGMSEELVAASLADLNESQALE